MNGQFKLVRGLVSTYVIQTTGLYYLKKKSVMEIKLLSGIKAGNDQNP